MNEDLSPIGRFHTLLLATDGSEFSAAAEAAAIELARLCQAHLLISRIVLSNPEYEALVPDRVQQQEQLAQQQLDDLASTARDQGVQAETILRHGTDPYQSIVRLADEKRADVIIMGRRTRSDLARLMVGDHTAKVIGLASCSVLVVPRGATMPSVGVLVATDGSRLGDAAAYSAIRLSRQCSLPLTVLSVHPPEGTAEEAIATKNLLEHVRKAASEEMVQVETLLESGRRPDEAILQTTTRLGADMIVVGSHGRTGLDRLLMGSVSERVIGKSRCPVLVVKATL
jgi:nucleotide-binding universal stress UspA family protein